MGEIYVGLLAATILFLATNAGLIGVSRLVYSMGIHRQLPDRLRRLHPRYRTPWIGILIFSAIAIGTILPGQEAFLGNLYAFGALLSFTFAHASVARLRAKKKDVPRPYRGPGNVNIRGYDAPLFAIVGGTFTFIAFVVIAVLYPTVSVFGVGWLALGTVVFVVYRRRQGLDLTSTHKVAIAQPVVDHEAEYDSVLVHFGDGGLRRPGAGDGAQARGAKAPRHPSARDRHGAELDGDRRADARAGSGSRGASSRRPRWRAAAACRATSSACAQVRPAGGSSRMPSRCARPRS